jgi:dienelactone hydrolase
LVLGTFILVVLVLIEVGFAILGIARRSSIKREKSASRCIIFAIFLLLVATSVIDWGTRWLLLGLFLGIEALAGTVFLLLKRKNKTVGTGRALIGFIGKVILIGIAVLPAFILPQFDPIQPTGGYAVGTVSYTLTDDVREEYFTEEKDNRSVTIQFWYPTNQPGKNEIVAGGKFPVVVFSHGAFGYRMSNYSMFQQLASHGYIVASIDHTYHAFMTQQTDGKTILANMKFMNDAMKAQNGDYSAEKVYELQREWMKLRTEDMAFVLNYIKNRAASQDEDSVFQEIDIEHIGVMGHSLGGATAAQIGREDADVDAVVVVDGTMLGEIVGFDNGTEVITDAPYPLPIMNLYNESHYIEAIANSDKYANQVVHRHAQDSYQVVIEGSGHMNFTDLPIVSPFLAGLLETGDAVIDVDARDCIETTNQVILEFFDKYLKSSDVEIPKERTL